ncbi:MAG: J domain-containing protein [Pseudanabaena frigida]|uniref:J domain-containing protein n=1 Tax=Pseudanabaena frigida TaxID=945775 RepID=A0A2W4YA35_9CYAN|nr:MAG: J domain-containing protein [Pseudanabaena frigida]
MENPRTFRIDRGIGQYDFNDYYAVLGLPLTAEASHVRKRYLLIAKCLHPDVHGRTSTEKQVATQYLSKLVNPAYNVLSQERERTEYSAILKLLGKRLMKRNQKFSPQSDIAKKYLISAKDINYEQTIQAIASSQYQDLNRALENIGLLSELNLVHILLQEGYRHSTDESRSSVVVTTPLKSTPSNNTGVKVNSIDTAANTTASSTRANNVNNTNTESSTRANSAQTSASSGSYQMRSEAQVPPRSASNTTNTSDTTFGRSQNSSSQASNNSSISQHIRQAESYINQQLWTSALKELRSAIQIDCNNSKCHALLGFVYMNQKLAGMAKVSFQQALKLNPEEPMAIKYINQVSGISPNTEKPPSKPKDDKKGGFFGWLGGG